MASVLDLTSVYAKVVRAEEHFAQVNDEIGTWINSGSHTFVAEVNGDYTRHVIVAVQHGPDPDYLRWTLILGDCINNLRCALDHLIYSVAKYQTVGNPAAKIESLSFVIADNADKFAEGKNRLRHLSPGVIQAIVSLQPYIRKHPISPPLLSILRDFSNADKHRLLRLASGGTVSTDLKFYSPLQVKKVIAISPDPIEDNAIICLVISPEPDPNLYFDAACKFGIEVCLWHGLRDGETNVMYSRTGYSVLIPWLIDEVKFAVGRVLMEVI